MGKDFQSIEDLISGSSDQNADLSDEQSTQAKFREKQKEIATKEVERATQKKAALFKVHYVNLVGFPVSPEALMLIAEEEARKMSLVCFYYDGRNLRLATTDPENKDIEAKARDLEKQYHAESSFYLVSENSFNYVLELYKKLPKIREFTKAVRISPEDLARYSEKFATFQDLQQQIDDVPTTDVVTLIMAAAIKAGASDIHIEAEEKEIKVRFRIDGMLHDVAGLEMGIWKNIISRMKILAGAKINVSDKPQDGRISIQTKNERIDVRASFLPTNYGESVVMRLLRSSVVSLRFEDLGVRGRAFKRLEREVERPNGMIIVTGPTGSGKTTTLYAVLKKLNKSETKIITIEDPIEYQLTGINQSQVSEKYTFAKALASIVRQDPDILMVGEIRDLETAEIAIQAALTGHLVLSTIHTNDAAGAIPRFLSMGAKPFLLAPAINAIVGQRLVRRICQHCKQEAEVSTEKRERIKNILEKLPAEEKALLQKAHGDNLSRLNFYRGGGCESCQGIGYQGRIGIYEIMIMNKDIEKNILSERVSEYALEEIAVKDGMVTMTQDGLLKAVDGITSVDEVFRVSEEK